jgi:hypothetical protein
MIEEARQTSRTMIGEAEDQVMRTRAKLDELNLMLREKARIANEEAKVYADIFGSVADCRDISELNPPCDLDCENCANKCEDYIPMDDIRDQIAEKEGDEPAAEETAEIAEEPAGGPAEVKEPECGEALCPEDRGIEGREAGESAPEEPEAQEESGEAPEELIGEAVENAAEAVAEKVEELAEEAGDAFEELAEDPAGEAHAFEQPAVDLPDDYPDASSLMRSIYSIEGRDLPDEDGETYDIGEGTPLTAESDEGFEMPVDPDFENLLGDILDDKK